MTTISVNKYDSDGQFAGTRNVVRNDAIWRDGRYFVPSGSNTKWIRNWKEFKEADGQICFNEDQTEITFRLPEPYKFSIQFNRES